MIRLLPEADWLEHGFGTREDGKWTDPARTAIVRQTHSDRVLEASQTSGIIGEGDALISNQPGMIVAIRTADCLPILMESEHPRAVAAVHAGWRGTVQHIAPGTVRRLAHRFGCVPGELKVAIGPGIGSCCFEVGPEVAVQFRNEASKQSGPNGKIHIDLAEENRRQLVEAGVRPEFIAISGMCTCCHPELFHSFRRDGKASGRLVSAIGIRNR